jgi:hypothetical protein
MANLRYPLGMKALLDGDIDLLNDTIAVQLVDLADYTYDAAHQFLTSLSSGLVGTKQTLASKTTTAVSSPPSAVFDAADVNFGNTTGDSAEAVVIFKDTGNASTSPVIALIDTATGLPVLPNGGPINIIWNASGIFSI